MPSLKIDTGAVRLLINDDESRVLEFNPNDVLFVEKFYRLMGNFKKKTQEFYQRIDDLGKNEAVDEDGVPENAEDRFTLLRDVCQFVRDEIDAVFGDGTSQMVFGSAYVIEVFEQFFEGIVPYVQEARKDKVEKYTKG